MCKDFFHPLKRSTTLNCLQINCITITLRVEQSPEMKASSPNKVSKIPKSVIERFQIFIPWKYKKNDVILHYYVHETGHKIYESLTIFFKP